MFKNFFSEYTGKIISILALSVLFISVIIFISLGSWDFSETLDESKVAQFGDFIGGIVGTLVAFAGIILYYVALTEQRKDIKINQEALSNQIDALNHQIEEFQAQREELIQTRKIYEIQTKTMRNQQFDSNFYSLLNVYVTLKSNLNESNKTPDFFKYLYDELSVKSKIKLETSLSDSMGIVSEQYTILYHQFSGSLSTYFKTVYRILKFIDETELLKENDERMFYAKILRSQITDYELYLIYYNCLSVYGRKSQNVILKYNILKHVRRLDKIEIKKHIPSIDEGKKIELVLFVEWLTSLVKINWENSKDFESPPINLQERYDPIKILVNLEIDTSISIILKIDEANLNNLPLVSNDFFNIMGFSLQDFFYHENFEKINLSKMAYQKIKNGNNLEVQFNIEIE